MTKDYSVDLQKLFLEMMVADSQSFGRVQNIFNPENFDRSIKSAAEFIKSHSEQFKAIPTLDQISAATGVVLRAVSDLQSEHYDWFLQEFESFTRKTELERAILKAADLLEKGNFDPVEKLIKDAVQISLTRDMGLDYFADPRARLMAIKSSNGQVSSGWPTLDQLLYGGMSRGELNLFCGGSGSGKSLVMANLSVNWIEQGLNGAYITLELSEELVSMRIDAMNLGIGTKEIFKNLDDVEMKIRMASKKFGKLRIKYLPAQSKVNAIRAYVNELRIQTGVRIDFLIIDYLDLLMPSTASVDPSNLNIKDKYVSEELRNLAKELNVLMVTASQLNRSSVEEIEFDHSHIAGGISKIQTADNVFGIFTSRSMRDRGKYQFQCMKTRSSTGRDSKIDLEYDVSSMRITDLGPEAQGQEQEKPSAAILNQIKAKTSITPRTQDTAVNEPQADVQSTKLRQMLANLKKGE